MDNISREVEGKSPEEVIEYSKASGSSAASCRTRADHGADREGRGQDPAEALNQEGAGRQDHRQIQGALPSAQDRLRNHKGKNYTEEEDRFLVCMLHKLGFRQGECLRGSEGSRIRCAPQFRFDWFIKSRTAMELQRRCNTLIML